MSLCLVEPPEETTRKLTIDAHNSPAERRTEQKRNQRIQLDPTRRPHSLILAAFLMTMSSAFGQTYFIGIFAPQLKHALGLSDGGFGGFYMGATLASACALTWAGRVADHFRIRGLAVCVLGGLGATCAAMAGISSAWLLLPVFFCLRLFGQGFLGHLSLTGVARWYAARRGRMISFAVLGFQVSQAAMPIVAVMLNNAVGWRNTWLAAALWLGLVAIPLVRLLLRHEPPHDEKPGSAGATDGPQRDWTRAEVMRTPAFFAVLLGTVASSFVSTAVLFNQANLVAEKGWTLTWFTAWFPAYATMSFVTALLTGWLIDRFDARQLLPLFLLPLGAGVAVLGLASSPLAVPAFMMLGAITNGSGATLLAALWAELFGTRHLGAIRSIAAAAQVLASALGPGVAGVLLDLGVGLEHQFIGMALYTLAACLWLKLLAPRLDRLGEA
jgi:MFS family permease